VNGRHGAVAHVHQKDWQAIRRAHADGEAGGISHKCVSLAPVSTKSSRINHISGVNLLHSGDGPARSRGVPGPEAVIEPIDLVEQVGAQFAAFIPMESGHLDRLTC
jgi:hypothetical protein